jgi:hypothetical protein
MRREEGRRIWRTATKKQPKVRQIHQIEDEEQNNNWPPANQRKEEADGGKDTEELNKFFSSVFTKEDLHNIPEKLKRTQLQARTEFFQDC